MWKQSFSFKRTQTQGKTDDSIHYNYISSEMYVKSTKTNQGIVEKEKITVKRRLGLLSCTCFIVGEIIGAGIFISPKFILEKTRSVGMCLVIWAVCGIISMCAALVYAELGTLIPRSGGNHAYFLKAYGPFVAFMNIWVDIFANIPGSMALQSLTMAEYLSGVLFDDCGPSENMKKIIAATSIVSVGITNCISVRLTARVQILFTFIKSSGLIVIIIGGIVWIANGRSGSLETGFRGTTDSAQDIALAVYSGLYAYGGWGGLNLVVEEIHRPERNLPLSIVISLCLVTVLYLLVNISYLAVLSKAQFLSSWAVGVTWAEHVMSPAVILIPVVVVCSVYGSSNGSAFTSTRLLFQAGREGHIPELFSYIHVDSRIPTPSVILLTLFSLLLLVPYNIAMLLNLLNFLGWLSCGMAMIAVMILRRTMKDTKRVVKVPLVLPVFILAISVYLVVAPFIRDPKIEFLYSLAFLGVGMIIYFPFVFFKLKPPGMTAFTRYGQKWLQVIPTHFKKEY